MLYYFDLATTYLKCLDHVMMAVSSSVPSEVKGRRRPLWKFPCSVCCKLVKCNQQGLFCDLCNRWCHSRCSDVSDTQYAHLSAIGPESPWFCQACIVKQLPFADCSFVSDTVSAVSSVFDDSLDDDHPIFINSTVLLCHLNVCSLLPAFDEIRDFMGKFIGLLSLGSLRHGLLQLFP